MSSSLAGRAIPPTPIVVVGVVSDTHLPRFGRRLPRALLDGLASLGVARILHAGDHTAGFVVEQLTEIAPVDAVAGNNDGPELVDRFGTARVAEVGGRRIGLTHGHLGRGRTTPERARGLFVGEPIDVVVFGHSHQPVWIPPSSRGPAMLNPGSPTDRRREPAFSYGVLEIGEHITGRIETFLDRTV